MRIVSVAISIRLAFIASAIALSILTCLKKRLEDFLRTWAFHHITNA